MYIDFFTKHYILEISPQPYVEIFIILYTLRTVRLCVIV